MEIDLVKSTQLSLYAIISLVAMGATVSSSSILDGVTGYLAPVRPKYVEGYTRHSRDFALVTRRYRRSRDQGMPSLGHGSGQFGPPLAQLTTLYVWSTRITSLQPETSSP